jgi:general secretion pathway protein D
VLPVLQEVLHASGLALVHTGGLYRVVPIEDAARSGGASVVVGSAQVPVTAAAPNFNIRVLPLRYASATELAQTLQPFVPKGTVIEADASRNLLIVTGVEADLASVVDLVGTFDVDWLAGMSYGIFPLDSATPKSVVNDLNEIFGGRTGTPLGGVVRFIPLERISAVLVISPQRQYIVKVGQWIRRLDTDADETTPRIFEYRVQNSRAIDLARVLSALFTGQVQTVGATAPGTAATTLGENYGASQPAASGMPSAGGGAAIGMTTPGSLGGTIPSPPGTASVGNAGLPQVAAPPTGTQPSPSGGQAISPEQTAEAALPGAAAAPGTEAGETGLPRVRIVADEKNNALLIYATPKVYRMIEDTLHKLDIVPLQVLIEATIAEVTLNDNLQYGVQWFFKNGSSSITLSNASTGAVSAIFPGFNYVLTGGAGPQVVLSALSAVTDVKVISSPQLLVLDNHVAALQVGDTVPVPTAQIQQTTGGAPLVNTIQYLDTGVILHVAPRVNSNGVISLDISQEVSDVVTTTTSNLDGPTIQQRKVLSSVSVRDGETIALGGLISDSVTLGNNGLPILSKLPLLGGLFGTQSNNHVRTELLILLSPHVLHNASEARQVTDELRQQMRLVTPLVVAPAPR